MTTTGIPWPGSIPWAISEERHYDGRLVRCFSGRPKHLDMVFKAAVASHPEQEALVSEDQRVTYAELDRHVENLAGNLAAHGVGKGDRVAILLGNLPEFVFLILACARLGVISVPLSVRQRRPENEFALAHCGAKVLVFEAGLAQHLPAPETTPDLKHKFSVDGKVAGTRPFEDLLQTAKAPEVVIEEEDVATILYTSGTTGQPKGAMLTHLGQIHSLMHFECGMQLQRGEERSVLCVPASHVTGLTAVILAMISVAGCTVMMREFKAARFLQLAARERLTTTIMVPAMYNLCLLQADFTVHDLSSWRIGGYGGAPMPTATIDVLARHLPNLELMNAYGATESTSPTTLMPLGHTAGHEDSVGMVLPCADVRVVDDEGRDVAAGESGEIWIAGPMVVPGYWRGAKATADAFHNGYWKSGDIGSVDADGYVRIFDRKKDMINRGGYKVYSAEVENVLSHHPDVTEAAVVARPDPVLGEKVQAFIVVKYTGCDAEIIKAFCAARLSDYKVPDAITVLSDGLPRNANGKVLKPALRTMVQQELQDLKAQQ